MSQLQVTDRFGHGIGDINIRISVGHGDSDAAIFDVKTDEYGTQGWPIPFWPVQDYTLHVNKRSVVWGFREAEVYVPRPADGQYPDVAITLESVPPSKLRAVGRVLHDAQGPRIIVGADSFQAYDRYLTGEVVFLRQVFAQLQRKGFNAIRVFGMDHHIPLQINRPPFKPQDFGQRYYDSLGPFCDLAAEYGLYVYFVVFADTGLIMPNEPEQRDHFGKVWRALAAKDNTLLSAGNELRQHDNFVDVTKLERPVGIVASAGSEGMDEPTHGPWWDVDEFHPRRDYPAAIKDCCLVDHPNYGLGLPMIIDEPDRFGSQGNPNAVQCGQQAGASRESAAGMVFHSKNGVYAIPLDTATEQSADAFLSAFRGVL